MVTHSEEARLAAVLDPRIRQLDVQVYGERNYVLGGARIPFALLEDFEAAWQAFQAAYPHYTMEQYVRYVFQQGTRMASRVVRRNRIPAPKINP